MSQLTKLCYLFFHLKCCEAGTSIKILRIRKVVELLKNIEFQDPWNSIFHNAFLTCQSDLEIETSDPTFSNSKIYFSDKTLDPHKSVMYRIFIMRQVWRLWSAWDFFPAWKLTSPHARYMDAGRRLEVKQRTLLPTKTASLEHQHFIVPDPQVPIPIRIHRKARWQ